MTSKDSSSSFGEIQRPALVWVVDDSPLESEMARRHLSAKYDVVVFSDGTTVIEKIANGIRPDVLVLDWHMPNMSGLDVCRFLRETYDEATLPILVLTATGGQDDLLEGLAAGANDFVTKLFDPAELLARVGTLSRAKFLHEGLKRTELATRRARDAADEANRAKDAFLATVSHELRTPLNAILGWATLLETNAHDEVTLKRGLETIQRNALIQVRLIEDLLDTTRVISGKLHLEISSFDFADVVRAAWTTHKPASDAKHLNFSLAFDDSLILPMRGDVGRLSQAVTNLLSNALKFTPAGGSVRVELEPRDDKVELRVVDSGRGISPDFLPHVFDRFRQQDTSATRRHSGLGLGLSLVSHIVAAHGGQARALSEGTDQGSTFVLELPRDQSNVSSRPPTETPALRSETGFVPLLPLGLHILIVEDDDDARALLRALLSQAGATVSEASSFSEALACIDVRVPDLLLSDIGLPQFDGYALVRAIRTRGLSAERLPAVALTAYSRPEDQKLAREAGFQAHIAKPVDPAELLRQLSTIVLR